MISYEEDQSAPYTYELNSHQLHCMSAPVLQVHNMISSLMLQILICAAAFTAYHINIEIDTYTSIASLDSSQTKLVVQVVYG